MSILHPFSVQGTDRASAIRSAEPVAFLHRIDAPHQRPIDSSVKESVVELTLAEVDELSQPCEPIDFSEFDPAAIRNAHADDLIEFLQRWSEELDERATRLHADIATHERRERAFRLWMQNRRLELDTQITACKLAQSQAEAIARRLAVTG